MGAVVPYQLIFTPENSPQNQVIATFENNSHDERETKSKLFVLDEANRGGLTAWIYNGSSLLNVLI
jgi:hypothetical protein